MHVLDFYQPFRLLSCLDFVGVIFANEIGSSRTFSLLTACTNHQINRKKAKQQKWDQCSIRRASPDRTGVISDDW